MAHIFHLCLLWGSQMNALWIRSKKNVCMPWTHYKLRQYKYEAELKARVSSVTRPQWPIVHAVFTGRSRSSILCTSPSSQHEMAFSQCYGPLVINLTGLFAMMLSLQQSVITRMHAWLEERFPPDHLVSPCFSFDNVEKNRWKWKFAGSRACGSHVAAYVLVEGMVLPSLLSLLRGHR